MSAASRQGLELLLRARLEKKPLLLMAHAVVGYPSLDSNRSMLESMADAGVDVVELQLPFSEPIADGPVFVRANQDAIDAGIRRDAYFDLIGWATRNCPFPVLFMGYYNSVYRMGEEAFCDRLAAAGAKGYIVADLPPEEARNLDAAGRMRGLDPILIMTPASSEGRIAEIAARASGLVYCVARKGVTGRRTELGDDVRAFLSRVRRATPLPLGLGFGLKTPEDVRGVRGLADVAIVGTACLESWVNDGLQGYRRFLRGLVAETL